MEFNKLLNSYNYSLPAELIAQKPASPRDSAKLLVFKRPNNALEFDTFENLAKYLPKNAVLVFNQTRVIPARLPLYKSTGGKVEALYVGRSKSTIQVLINKKLSVGTKLFFRAKDSQTHGHKFKQQFYFEITAIKDGIYSLKPKFAISKLKLLISKYGLTPLPPYMKNSPLTEKTRRMAYQTIFAKKGESVAAPTASLHFTSRLINRIKKQGIAIKFIRLDVNLGTFAPLKEQQLKQQQLHAENYFISSHTYNFLQKAKQQGRPIIAVGTTVVRTLESVLGRGEYHSSLYGQTRLFISPGYKFKIVNGIITNFHVPKSSLLMLVSALVGRKKLLEIYHTAIKKQFRFFSFGDGMLII